MAVVRYDPAAGTTQTKVVVRYEPDLQRQVQALLRLLGHTGPETRQPQDHVVLGLQPSLPLVTAAIS